MRFFTDWDDFDSPALPRDLETYLTYRERTLAFVEGRNARIQAWSNGASAGQTGAACPMTRPIDRK